MLSLYLIKNEYACALSKLDSKVMNCFFQKDKRPFIGILFMIEDIKYIAPLSSPKSKHKTMKNNIDFLKIANGDLGVINFNNMIPVKMEYITKIVTNEDAKKEDSKYIVLLNKQLSWINKRENAAKIINKAKKLRDKYINDTLPMNIKNRCVNFVKLEKYLLNEKN